MKRFLLVVSVILLTGALLCPNASAHYLSVNADKYFPKVGEEITISLGMEHQFPAKESGEVKKMEKMYVIGPDGNQIDLKMMPEGEKKLVAPIKIKFDKPGTYLVVAEKKKGFVTKTTDGYQQKSKKELKNVVKSYWSEGHAKAIIVVGKPSGNAAQKSVGWRFQVIPSADPGTLKKGDALNAAVTLDGKPLDTEVSATYAGFSAEKDIFAQKAKTDKGSAKIELSSSGVWLIKANHSMPYSNLEEADEHSFTSSVTFGVGN